ncbi:helix-turn-helix transcriptional regulator [Pannonibacter sp. SL95]|nr:hypothetical protein [Pannonibacter sp. SL95]MCY1704522.1 hypothetical protein [Pannonibacter sp. SL95]
MPVAPRGLNRGQAAQYVGISVTLFDRLVAEGVMPAARALAGRLVWDIVELDRHFDELPHANGNPAPARTARLHDDFVD